MAWYLLEMYVRYALQLVFIEARTFDDPCKVEAWEIVVWSYYS